MDHRSLYKTKTGGDKNTKTKRIERLMANRTANRNDLHQMGRNITVNDEDFSSDEEVINPVSPVIKQAKASEREEFLRKFAAWKKEKMKKQTNNANKKPAFCSAVVSSKTFAPDNHIFKAPATVKQYKSTAVKPKTLPKPIKVQTITKQTNILNKLSPRVTRSKTLNDKKLPNVQIPKKMPAPVKVKSNTKPSVPNKSDKKPLRLKMKKTTNVEKPQMLSVPNNFAFSVDGTKITSTSRKSKCEMSSENIKSVEIPFDVISPIEITPFKPCKSDDPAQIKTTQRSTNRKRRLSLENVPNNVNIEKTVPEKIERNPMVLLEKIKSSIQKRKTIHVEKIESGKKKSQRKSLAMKLENNVPDDLNSTPINRGVLNTSLTYMSPFVTTARGKGSAKREKRNRDSVYKPNGSTEEPIELRQGREAGIYFRKILQNEIDRLLVLCDEWNAYKSDNETTIISDHLDSIDVAIGQAKLLINKKFEQFRSLIVQCEQYTGEQKVLPEDLEGFWAMVYMQVENIDKRFKDLSAWRDNGWEDPIKLVKKTATRKKLSGRSSPAIRKTRNTLRRNVVDSHNPIKNLIRRARIELMEKNKLKSKDAAMHDSENVAESNIANPVEQFVNSPMRNRKSLLTTVLLSEARKSSSKKRRISKEKENYVESLIPLQSSIINIDNALPPIKSILKTPGVTRKGKGVVFTEPKNYVTPLRLSSPSCPTVDYDEDDDQNNSDHCHKKRRTTENEKYRMTPHNKKRNTLTPVVNLIDCNEINRNRLLNRTITMPQPSFDELE